MKVKLTNIRVSHANKDGQPYLDKLSRPYNRVGIQTEQHGKTWLSGFAYQDNPMLKWHVGEEVEINVEQKGQYTNFSLPKTNGGSSSPDQWKTVNDKLDRIIAMISDLEPVDGPDPEDPSSGGLPF